MLTLGGQQVPLSVRPAEARMVAHPAVGSSSNKGGTRGQALEVQLPGRILYVRDAGGSTAQLVHAEVDGQAVHLQVLAAGPRHYHLQHCGAQRLVQVDSPAAAQLAQHMPPPVVEDFSKVGADKWAVGRCVGAPWLAGMPWWLLPGNWAGGAASSVAIEQPAAPACCALACVYGAPCCCLQVVRSPMPGTLVSVSVVLGQRVSPGDEVCYAAIKPGVACLGVRWRWGAICSAMAIVLCLSTLAAATAGSLPHLPLQFCPLPPLRCTGGCCGGDEDAQCAAGGGGGGGEERGGAGRSGSGGPAHCAI